jgi:hypothetical protein
MAMFPWEQQLKESEEAYEAFIRYRDQPRGERSQAKVAESLGKSTQLISRWSSTWNWVARCQAWDAHRQTAADEAQIQAIRDMNSRHATDAVELQKRAIEGLKKVNISALTASQLLDFLTATINIERMARGDALMNSGAAPGKGKDGASICKLYAGIDFGKI